MEAIQKKDLRKRGGKTPAFTINEGANPSTTSSLLQCSRQKDKVTKLMHPCFKMILIILKVIITRKQQGREKYKVHNEKY